MGLKDNIKRERREKGYTLEYVATAIGISKQTMQKYESGVVLNIPSNNIEKIAKVLDTTPAQLMGWDIDNTIKKIEPATDEASGFNRETKALVNLYHELSEDDKDLLMRQAELLIQRRKK